MATDNMKNSNTLGKSNFGFWQKWLFAGGILTVFLGLFMAFFNWTTPFLSLETYINIAFWGNGSIQPVSSNTYYFQRWIYGVTGATTAGWGVFIAYVAKGPFARKENWARNCTAIGLTLWFLIDFIISTYYKVYFNSMLDLIIFALMIAPVIVTWKKFDSTQISTGNEH